MTQPTEPVVDAKKSPKGAAPSLHAGVRRLLAELASLPEDPLEGQAGALFVAHLIIENGRDHVLAMKRGDVVAALTKFRTERALVGHALDVADVIRFVFMLDKFGAPHAEEVEYRALMLEIVNPPKAPAAA